jgi:hypothetical protein
MKNPMILRGKNIIFLSSMSKYECYDTIPFDPGMKAKVLNVFQHPSFCVNYVVELDFSDFEQENIEVASKSWCGPNGRCSLHWHETEFYPEKRTARITFFNDHPPFKILKED